MNREISQQRQLSFGPVRVAHAVPRSWLLVSVIALGACDGFEERPAAWSYIHAAIISPTCATASCHSNAGSLAGLDLSTRESAYVFLVGRTCDAPPHPGDAPGNFVFPYDPERSRLTYLLRGDETTVMPPDVPLPEVEIALIERWILDGAPCN